MELHVIGRSKYLSKTLTRKAVRFYADKLMTPRLLETLCIKILYDDLGADMGRCDPLYERSTSFPKDFEIYIANNLNKKNTLLTIAHEMVHLKQYARGELFEYARHPNLARWKGYVYEDDPETNNPDDYWFTPWEIEAHGYEKGLATCFYREMYRQGFMHKLKPE